MADTVSWAQAQLPSNRNFGVESMFRSALMGQAIGQGRKEAEKQAKIDALRQKVLDSYKGQDRPGMMYAISELARYDPEAAEESRSIYSNLDRTNGFQAAMLTYTAAASDKEDAQNMAIDQALDAMQVGPEHPFYQGLLEIKNMPFGKKRDEALINAVQMGQQLGFFPTKEEMYSVKGGGPGADKTEYMGSKILDWLEYSRKATGQRETNDRLQEQLELEQKKQEFTESESKYEKTNLSKDETKLVIGWNEAARSSETEYQSLMNIADSWADPDLYKRWRGVSGSFRDRFVRIFGMKPDKIDFLIRNTKAKINQAIRKAILESRPTDFDFKVTAEGFPTTTDNPELLQQWFRGAAKVAGVESAHDKARSEYIQMRRAEGKDFGGFPDYWDKYGDWYITQVIGDPVDKDGNPIQRKPPKAPPKAMEVPENLSPPTMDIQSPSSSVQQPQSLMPQRDTRSNTVKLKEAFQAADQLGVRDRLRVKSENGRIIDIYYKDKNGNEVSLVVPPSGM